MAATFTLNNFPQGLSRDINVTRLYGKIVFSGSYVTGGETLNLPAVEGLDVTTPVDVFISGSSGFTYNYDKTAKKVKVMQGGAAVSSPSAEIPAAAYPTGVTGDNVRFEAVVSNS